MNWKALRCNGFRAFLSPIDSVNLDQAQSLLIRLNHYRVLHTCNRGLKVLSDSQVKSLKAKEKRYSMAAGEGVSIDVLLSREKTWFSPGTL